MTDFGFDQSRSDLIRGAGRSLVEGLCENRGENKWDYPQFKRVVVNCAVFGEYPTARFRPEQVDLGRLNRHVRDLQRRSDETGFEFGRTFLADIEQRTILYGRTSWGDETGLTEDTSRAHLQRVIAFAHVHPRQHLIGGRVNPFSGADFSNLVSGESRIFSLLSMGDYTLMTMKTSVTPRNPSAGMIEELTSGIVREFTVLSDKRELFWRGIRQSIRANKEVCLALGLMFYLGKTGEPLKRVPLVNQSEAGK